LFFNNLDYHILIGTLGNVAERSFLSYVALFRELFTFVVRFNNNYKPLTNLNKHENT